MKTLLTTLGAIALLSAFLPSTAKAGGTGYVTVPSCSPSRTCAESKWQTPRYNQTLPYRHFEDRRRYNAAPCQGQVDPGNSYLVKTVVVRKKREPYYYYDSRGRRLCKRVLVTTYKDLFSNGSCRVWTTRG
jgi:hypothetical protein